MICTSREPINKFGNPYIYFGSLETEMTATAKFRGPVMHFTLNDKYCETGREYNTQSSEQKKLDKMIMALFIFILYIGIFGRMIHSLFVVRLA